MSYFTTSDRSSCSSLGSMVTPLPLFWYTILNNHKIKLSCKWKHTTYFWKIMTWRRKNVTLHLFQIENSLQKHCRNHLLHAIPCFPEVWKHLNEGWTFYAEKCDFCDFVNVRKLCRGFETCSYLSSCF